MSVAFALVAVISLLAILVAFLNRRRNALLSRVPGPPLFLPLFGNMMELLWRLSKVDGDYVELGESMVRKYGTVYKLWTGHTPYVLISNPEDTEAVLTHPAVAEKGEGYQLIAPWLGDGLLLAGGDKWHRRRKLIAPAFGARVLEKFTETFNKHAAILERKMRERVGQGPFDVVPLMSLCALDVISETAMGVQINAQLSEDSDYVRAVKMLCRCFFQRQVYPWLRSDTMLRLSSVGKNFYNAVSVLHKLTHKVIRERESEITKEVVDSKEDDVGLKQRPVLLDFLLSESIRGKGITDKDITDEVNTFLFAGHDTTMTSMCFTLHLLSKNPAAQEAAAQEVREVVGDSDVISSQHLQDLKYLERVLKESLRLYPSVPCIVRNCTQEFTLPSGYVIPPGTQVALNLVHLQRNPDLFPEPLTFDPDRFLPDRVEGRHHFSYIPFSALQRNCIGQKFAMMEMKITLARLLRSFVLLPPHEKDYSLRMKSEIVLGAHDGILVQLRDRPQT